MSRAAHLSSKDTTAAAESLSVIIKKELTYYACKGYLDPSDPTMITDADRKILVDWCYGVVDNCDFSRETVAVAMEMVDRFLSVTAGPAALWETNSDVARVGNEVLHSKGKFQLLTIAALYSSIKIGEKVVLSREQFAEMCCAVYTKEEIEDMERTLLRGLSWRHNTSTAYQAGHSILSLMIPYVNLPEATWAFLLDEMKYQTEHAVRDYFFSTQRTSTIALAAIFNAIEGISSEEHHRMISTFLSRVVECFEFDHSDLMFVARQRLRSLLDSNTSNGEDLDLDFSVSSIDADDEAIVDFDDITKTFENDITKTFEIEFEDTTMFIQQSSISPDRVEGDLDDVVTAAPKVCESMTMPTQPAALFNSNSISKPKRPLTAYHLYLQLEREFIIQTMEGEDANKSIHNGKVYLDDVPERYRQILLPPDWYFGPNKKTKRRKHRKQHGKVGFLELSKIIAERWATLDETNPEIKSYVQKIANQELKDYRRELEEYKKLTNTLAPSAAPSLKRALSDCSSREEDSSKNSSKARKVLTPNSSFHETNKSYRRLVSADSVEPHAPEADVFCC
jgi:hypothetical protein